MEFEREDVAALFLACQSYQRNNGDPKTQAAMSDQAFIDEVQKFHTKNDNEEHALALEIDLGKYNRHKNGAIPKDIKKEKLYLESLAMFLEEYGYWPFDKTMEQTAEALCEFFGVKAGSRSSTMLPELTGQYRSFQLSSWYKDHVQISTVSFTSPGDANPHLLVTEQQATGDKAADELGVLNSVESFVGVAFPRENMLYMVLREERQRRPKFCLIYQMLPDREDRPAMYLQGFTLKGSSSPNSRLHISRLILERLPQPIDGATEEMTDDDSDEQLSRAMSAPEFKTAYPKHYKRLFEVPLTEF